MICPRWVSRSARPRTHPHCLRAAAAIGRRTESAFVGDPQIEDDPRFADEFRTAFGRPSAPVLLIAHRCVSRDLSAELSVRPPARLSYTRATANATCYAHKYAPRQLSLTADSPWQECFGGGPVTSYPGLVSARIPGQSEEFGITYAARADFRRTSCRGGGGRPSRRPGLQLPPIASFVD
jgi:hypothetical protein